ncbi:MAG: dethiobiotin synthase [Thermodesulfovibrionales bacterium]|nr:dethiobiotin synthase [Thermodesulfovibrionales bacterium]
MKGFFVTGTDTGVGKTVVSAILIHILKLQGLKTCAMKPFETGCLREGGVLIPSDGMFLKDAANMEESVNYVTPVCLEKPLAPMVAAELEGVEIDMENVWRSYAHLKKKYEAIIVEGVGGLLVPIKKDYFVADLIKDFGLPVIVVSRPKLGTINHTLLTLRELSQRGISVKGIVFNYSSPPEGTIAEETNPSVISRLTDIPVIGVIPYLKSFDPETLIQVARKNLNLKLLEV